jgi:sporulation protein YlmC with PRC-barrel domain
MGHMRLQLGIPGRCTDGPYGELCDVVVDPARRRITHVVVEPHHHHALARLVPVELADVDLSDEATSRPALSLRCTIEELHRLAPVQESAYVGLSELPPGDPQSNVGAQDVLTLPDDGYSEPAMDPDWDDPHVSITYDSVPRGEIELRRKSVVTSADGHRLGHVAAVVVDIDHQVRELVLERGLLWARRELTIPIGAVARMETDSVTLKLTKAADGGS